MNKAFQDYHVYWIGPRESDIQGVKDRFAGSVTFFGSGSAQGYRQPFSAEAAPAAVFAGSESGAGGDDIGVPGVRWGNFCMSREKSIDHNDMSDQSLDRFVLKMVKTIRANDGDARFYLYNPNVIRPHGKNQIDADDKTREEKYALPGLSFYNENYLARNDLQVMAHLDSKIDFRSMLDMNHFGSENLLDIKKCKGDEIRSYYTMCQKFDVDTTAGVRFIVQENFSSGGVGTHILSKPKYGDELTFNPVGSEQYLCSILQEDNVSVNAHVILFEDSVLVLPASVQLICENNNCLLYRGGDFVSYRTLREDIRRRFEGMCAQVAYLIKRTSGDQGDGKRYRGVLGIDAIIHNGKIEILECNNRFQSSTYMLNLTLTERGLPSVQDLNLDAFDGIRLQSIAAQRPEYYKPDSYNRFDFYRLEIDVDYSNFDFLDSGNNYMHAKAFYALAEGYLAAPEEGAALHSLATDGFQPDAEHSTYAHLYRATFRGAVSAISPDGSLLINENVCEPVRAWCDQIFEYDMTATKIALLVQGVRISDPATKEYLAGHGGFRPATNDAIDLYLHKPVELEAPNYRSLVVNAPVFSKGEKAHFTRFTEFSPFELRVAEQNDDGEDHRLGLYYYGELINDNVSVFPEDPLADRRTSKGHAYSEIAFMSGDRLRVHTTNRCKFKQSPEGGCQFCNMPCADAGCGFTLDEVEEVVRSYAAEAESVNLQHYLVGGQTSSENDLRPVDIVRLIRRIDPTKRIYVMTVPPEDKQEIIDLVRAGASEFSFNIELFNSYYAKKYMPGKAKSYSRDAYFKALNQARFVLDDDVPDCVRSMLIVGLEPMNSLRQGIRLLLENGIQPMLSVFRPLYGTGLAEFLPPSMRTLYQLYFAVEKECAARSLHLGPSCHYCQNNTLSMPYQE